MLLDPSNSQARPGIAANHSAELKPFLERLERHSTLEEDERRALLSLGGSVERYKARHEIIRNRHETKHCSLIVSGLVACGGLVADGSRQITGFYIAGDVAELHAAVRPARMGGLTALTDTTLLQIPVASIQELAADYPAIAAAFWHQSALDLAIVTQWLINIGRRCALTRIAHLFCEMAIRYSPDREPLSTYELPVTQEVLGDALALTAVHVNRQMRILRERGLVSFSSGTVTIDNWPELARLAEFTGEYLRG